MHRVPPDFPGLVQCRVSKHPPVNAPVCLGLTGWKDSRDKQEVLLWNGRRNTPRRSVLMKIVREGNSITSIRADPAARIAARHLNWIWTHLLASGLQTAAIANDATSFGMAHVERQERIMVAIGDIVERVGGRSKFTTGRVTGFTPNGMVRVRVSPFEDRFWPQCQTKVTLSGELVVLRRRLERWIDSCGGVDEAMKVARLLFPDNPTYR